MMRAKNYETLGKKEEIHIDLTKISNDTTEKATTRCESQEILRRLERFETNFGAPYFTESIKLAKLCKVKL